MTGLQQIPSYAGAAVRAQLPGNDGAAQPSRPLAPQRSKVFETLLRGNYGVVICGERRLFRDVLFSMFSIFVINESQGQ